MDTSKYFKDLKVIELASVLAGPAVGMFFSELGADVIKVENKPGGGDVTRSWKLPVEDTECEYSAYFCSVNWQKKHFFLDLSQENDQSQVHEWIKAADVVISNFKTSSALKMRMDYATLKSINPTLIFAQIYSFEEENDVPAYDIVLQAETGFLSMTGEKDRLPVRMPIAMIDLMAAHQLKEGILLAMIEKYRTGIGAFVSVSLYDAALASLANQASNYLMTGVIPQRMGSQHPNIAPYGDVFISKDNQMLVFAVGTDVQFEKLCKVLGAESLLQYPGFVSNALRVIHRSELVTALQDKIILLNSDSIIAGCKQYHIPAGSIKDLKEVFARESAQRLVLTEKMHDGKTTKRVKTAVFKIRH